MAVPLYPVRRPEPLPLAQRVRDLLDESGALVERIEYQRIPGEVIGTNLDTRNPWLDIPDEVEVTVRFRVILPRR